MQLAVLQPLGAQSVNNNLETVPIWQVVQAMSEYSFSKGTCDN